MTWLVTLINQENGLYPVDADSIGIPIMFTIHTSLLLTPVLIAISLFPNKLCLIWLRSKNIARLIITKILLLLLYGGAFWFAISGFFYWNIPNHHIIALSYLLMAVFLAVGLVIDWQKT